MNNSPSTKILVVDDSKTIRTKLEMILSRAGYEVITASDGQEALAKMDEQPSLVVLDVNMPRLDGYGFCEKMKPRDEQIIPIVFLTSLKNKALEFLGTEYGAYLQKPVDANELLGVVAEQLGKNELHV